MNRMDTLYDVTIKLQELLDQPVKETNREEIIAGVQLLLNERELVIKDIVKPYTEEELIIGKKIIPIDQEILKKTQRLFLELKSEIRNVKKQKASNQKYIDPYKSLANYDSAFVDKKK
ncbi:flagellar protein FliT [Paraliobacillus sediminis]|uniref:flagellar protein FliT n=1 Tax=Paraliobacillus sediminis TaxID=1885916 RepID=UPI000E3D706A|nr:flagellar protein FliT [Paraliobacillus sediminis]